MLLDSILSYPDYLPDITYNKDYKTNINYIPFFYDGVTGRLILAILLYAIFIPLIIVMIISFLLPAIALYSHAQIAGYDKPWLAFIPFAQTYLEYILPRRRFKVLFIDTHEREKMALIVILVSTFGKFLKLRNY